MAKDSVLPMPKQQVLLVNGRPFDATPKLSKHRERFQKFLENKPNEVFTKLELIKQGFGNSLLSNFSLDPKCKSYTHTDGKNRFYGSPEAIALLIKTLEECKREDL
jgi:hypothetical protein